MKSNALLTPHAERSRGVALFYLLLVGTWGAAENGFAAAKPWLVNGIAATVGRTVISVQDAYFFRALHRFKNSEKDMLKPEQGEDLRKTVQKIIFEEMVSEEMKSLKVEAGARSEIEKNLKTLKAANGKAVRWASLLAHFGKTEGAAIDVLFKSAQVEKFLQKKVETMTPVITQVEVERYIKQNETRLQGSNTANLRPNIVLLLKKQQMEKGLEEWIRFLRDKYGVANYLDS